MWPPLSSTGERRLDGKSAGRRGGDGDVTQPALVQVTLCPLVPEESSSGCLRNGVEMSSPVFRRLVVTARGVALLIYYPASNLPESPGSAGVCGKCLMDGV